jgi:prepilin-type N-terminal cleavage/methylation domain-containing protein
VSTEPRGFTLIEVLVAMVLLGVGLMAVQALGFSAARSTALAERHTEYALAATRTMEQVIDSLRSGLPVASCSAVADAQAATFEVFREIRGDGAGRLRIVVEARAKAGMAGQPPAWQIETDLYLSGGGPC